jgi:hypothetical protein
MPNSTAHLTEIFMKTQMFRAWVLGVAITTLALGTGCHSDEARAEVPDADKLVPELAPANVAPDLAPPPARIDLDTAEAIERAASVSTNVAPPKVVANPVMPANLKVSSSLAEVLKLAQAGVSEDVMLAYIIHSTNFFDVGSDVIVYLNDLGVSNQVITTLIHHDSTPEMQARRQAAVAVQPLPANVALSTPATNVYPPAVSQTAPPPAPDATAAPPPPADAAVTAVSAPEEPVNVSYFYSSLAPYGTWVEVDGYGLAWQPTVVVSNPGWRPYCDRGRWIWSDSGWYWYSDYSWGWAPFHYGRWCDYPRLGWVWVPDSHWGPSWVSWRYSSSYCGWAPLPPACHYRPGFGFSYYGSSVGFSFGFDFGLSFHHYNYVPFNRFCDRSPGLHVLRPERARAIHRETTVVNNYVVGNNNTIINNGIGRDRVAAATRGVIPTATVRETATRGSTRREQLVNNGSSLAIVRPTLPERPERSHVAVPNRANIARVSADSGQTVPANSRLNTALRRDAAPSAAVAERPASQNGGGNRPAILTRDTSPSVTRGGSGEPAAPSTESRPAPAAATRPSSQTALNSARNPGATQRDRIESFRSYARPGETRNETTPQVAVNNPSPSPSVSRPQASAPSPVVATPSAPAVTRPSAPAASRPAAPALNRPSAPTPAAPRPATAPNSAARIEQFRNFGNAAVAARPNAPAASASAPQVSRPAMSAPAPQRSSPGASRPEPSRPSFSAPAQSAPSRSAPSYSAPSRPSPSYSSPGRSSSGSSGGGNRGGGRGRGDN